MEASVVNNARQRDARANGQRAVWADVGLKLDGRDDQAHIAILDHPKNDGYPTPWRVDRQFGIGPSRAVLGDWKIAQGKSATYRHQFIIYTGNFNDLKVDEAWKDFSGEQFEGAMWGLARNERQPNGVWLWGLGSRGEYVGGFRHALERLRVKNAGPSGISFSSSNEFDSTKAAPTLHSRCKLSRLRISGWMTAAPPGSMTPTPKCAKSLWM